MSLWPVSDYVTRDMMTSYYRGLKRGLGRGEALRQAQLAMLKSAEYHHHPYYWASFIQAGAWTGFQPPSARAQKYFPGFCLIADVGRARTVVARSPSARRGDRRREGALLERRRRSLGRRHRHGRHADSATRVTMRRAWRAWNRPPCLSQESSEKPSRYRHALRVHGSRDERYATRSTISASVRSARTGIINAAIAPFLVPSFRSYICRAR
jgi:hypothetical protein